MTTTAMTTEAGAVPPLSYGLDFICKHFKQDNSIWPKLVCAGDRWRLLANKRDKALAFFMVRVALIAGYRHIRTLSRTTVKATLGIASP